MSSLSCNYKTDCACIPSSGGVGRTLKVPPKKRMRTKLGPNSWNEVQVMYTQKEINDVLKIYARLNSLRGTVRFLGYPSRTKLREWLRERRETGQVRAKSCLRGNNELRKKATKTYIQSRRSLQTAINQFGYNVSQRTIQNWVKKFYPKARKLNNGPIKFHPKRFS